MDRLELISLILAGIGILGLAVFGFGYENKVKISEIREGMEGMWVKVCGNVSGKVVGENWFGRISDGTGDIRAVAFGFEVGGGYRCIEGIVESYKGELEVIVKRYD